MKDERKKERKAWEIMTYRRKTWQKIKFKNTKGGFDRSRRKDHDMKRRYMLTTSKDVGR